MFLVNVGCWLLTPVTDTLHKYFGGVVSFSEEDMKRINGYPNTFWGWGGEGEIECRS